MPYRNHRQCHSVNRFGILHALMFQRKCTERMSMLVRTKPRTNDTHTMQWHLIWLSVKLFCVNTAQHHRYLPHLDFSMQWFPARTIALHLMQWKNEWTAWKFNWIFTNDSFSLFFLFCFWFFFFLLGEVESTFVTCVILLFID